MQPNPDLPWPIPVDAVNLIAQAEGCRLKAYRCPAGKLTCGWGSTLGIKPDTEWTQEYADSRLCAELRMFAEQVEGLCTEHPMPNQLGALTSLAYNIGIEAFKKSSVLKAHNRADWQAAARAFSLWDKATVDGKLTTLKGLTARRAAEAAMYLKPEPDAPHVEMPQAVANESKVAASPIAQGGATTAGVGLVAALAEAKDALGPVGEGINAAKHFMADVLGVPPSWILPAVLLAVGVVVVRWRLLQRRDGWA